MVVAAQASRMSRRGPPPMPDMAVVAVLVVPVSWVSHGGLEQTRTTLPFGWPTVEVTRAAVASCLSQTNCTWVGWGCPQISDDGGGGCIGGARLVGFARRVGAHQGHGAGLHITLARISDGDRGRGLFCSRGGQNGHWEVVHRLGLHPLGPLSESPG